MANELVYNIYKTHYAYHHAFWLQGKLSVSYLESKLATKEEIEKILLLPKDRFLDLESTWTCLSEKVKQSLADEIFVENISTSVADLNNALEKLKLFTKLSAQERTRILDQFFPEFHSSELYENNLFSFRLQERSAVCMIGLMSPSNWNAWIRLLNALSDSQ